MSAGVMICGVVACEHQREREFNLQDGSFGANLGPSYTKYLGPERLVYSSLPSIGGRFRGHHGWGGNGRLSVAPGESVISR